MKEDDAPPRSRTFEIAARVAIGAAAGLAIVFLGLAIAGRLAFPYPLEWMEGVVIDHAKRVLHGEPLYGPPAGRFVPLIYAPVSYGVMAGLLAMGSASLAWARAASVAATVVAICSAGLLAARAARPEHRPWAAILAAGIYASGFAYCGTFYDLCRVDAVAIALASGAVALIVPGARARSVAGFVLLALSVLAKQQCAPVMLAVTVLAARERRLVVPALVGWAGLFLIGGAIQLASGGWFWTYAVTVPGGHALHPGVAALGLLFDFALPLPFVVAASAIAVGEARRRVEPLHAAAIGGVIASILGRAHEGAFDNVLMTSFVFLAPCAAAVVVGWVLNPDLSRTRRVLALAALGLQLLVLVTPPGALVPTRADLASWRRAERALRECARGRPAVALDHAGLGGSRFAQTMAISDVLAGAPKQLARRTRDVIVRALDPRALGAVAVGDATFEAMDRALLSGFEACAQVPALPMQVGHDPGPLRIFSARPVRTRVPEPDHLQTHRHVHRRLGHVQGTAPGRRRYLEHVAFLADVVNTAR